MDVNEELDEHAADRLLSGELAPDEVATGYRQVANLLAAARAEPSAAELSRQADTVRAMAAARRGGGEGIGASTASLPMRLAQRRNVRIGVLAAAATMTLTTGLAAAGLLPGPLQSIADRALPSLGDSSSDSGGKGGPMGPAEPAPPQPGPGPGPSEGPAAPGGGPSAPPEGKGGGPQQEPKTSPGQAKQAAKAVLSADAATSGGRLVVSFQETGVGPGAVTVTARADATATYGCMSNGRSQRLRKEARASGVSEAGGRFTAVGGRVGGTLSLLAPGPADVSCASGEAPQLLRVLYSRVVVLDTTTGATTTINRSFQATP